MKYIANELKITNQIVDFMQKLNYNKIYCLDETNKD